MLGFTSRQRRARRRNQSEQTLYSNRTLDKFMKDYIEIKNWLATMPTMMRDREDRNAYQQLWQKMQKSTGSWYAHYDHRRLKRSFEDRIVSKVDDEKRDAALKTARDLLSKLERTSNNYQRIADATKSSYQSIMTQYHTIANRLRFNANSLDAKTAQEYLATLQKWWDLLNKPKPAPKPVAKPKPVVAAPKPAPKPVAKPKPVVAAPKPAPKPVAKPAPKTGVPAGLPKPPKVRGRKMRCPNYTQASAFPTGHADPKQAACYLKNHPDVAKAVKAKIQPSALWHYRCYGHREKRKWGCKPGQLSDYGFSGINFNFNGIQRPGNLSW